MTKTTIINGQEVPLIKAEVITTYRNKKTGVIYKDEEAYKAANILPEDLEQDVKVIMPALDLCGKNG